MNEEIRYCVDANFGDRLDSADIPGGEGPFWIFDIVKQDYLAVCDDESEARRIVAQLNAGVIRMRAAQKSLS
jgi:hypothetical protein